MAGANRFSRKKTPRSSGRSTVAGTTATKRKIFAPGGRLWVERSGGDLLLTVYSDDTPSKSVPLLLSGSQAADLVQALGDLAP